MKNTLFKTKDYLVGDSTKAACLFAGYRGKISGFDSVIKTLNDLGYSVFAYEHDPAVLKLGNPQDLLDMLDKIHEDVFIKTRKYKKIICLGVSLGVGIGFSFQRLNPDKFNYGLYAGAGVSPSGSIFKSPIFYFVRKAYQKNNFDEAKIYKIWEEHEITPKNPLNKSVGFTVVLGKRDKIVKYREAISTYRSWIKAGVTINIITKGKLGHIGTIRWFKRNIGSLLDDYEDNSTLGVSL